MSFVLYPFLLVKFWYFDAVKKLISLGLEVCGYVLELLSVPLMLQTFFSPIKNEYRKDLIVFSTIFGICVKTLLLFVSILIIIPVFIVELLFILLFLSTPIVAFYLLFI